MALIYQSCGKTDADLSAELVLQQDTRVIYETFLSDHSQRMNEPPDLQQPEAAPLWPVCVCVHYWIDISAL